MDSRKYHRRQVALGIFVLVLSVFTVAEGFYFRHQDGVQRDCIAHAFSELNHTLSVRGNLVDRETRATSKLLTDAIKYEHDGAERARVVRRYLRQIADIQQTRRENPVPPYPEGTCNGG